MILLITKYDGLGASKLALTPNEMNFPRHSIFPDMPYLQPHPQRLLFPQYFPPRMVFPHQYGGGSGPGRLHYLPPAANFTHQMPLHPYLVSA